MLNNLIRAAVTTATGIPPELKALNRQPPQWWKEAGLGIFIHWTLASVPGFAPRGFDIPELVQQGHPLPLSESPYAEWYMNSMKFPDSSTAKFHKTHYGDLPYSHFKSAFEAGLDQWNPTQWAEAFAQTGAAYVVFVSKHHDGYCLWPTEVENPHMPNWHSKRDIVGELAKAVRAAGMKFGLYYSGGFDFTFNTHPVGKLSDNLRAVPYGDYPQYAAAHVRELVERYQPDVLWNDICWPAPQKEIYKIFQHYFSVVPEGVVNDRWMPIPNLNRLLNIPGVEKLINYLLKQAATTSGIVPPPVPFSQFRTPEYAELPAGLEGPWEMTRGLDLSFGYNQLSKDEDFLSQKELLSSLTHTMKNGGNYLINIGPRGTDAQIPDVQLTRLQWMAEQNKITPWKNIRTGKV